MYVRFVMKTHDKPELRQKRAVLRRTKWKYNKGHGNVQNTRGRSAVYARRIRCTQRGATGLGSLLLHLIGYNESGPA